MFELSSNPTVAQALAFDRGNNFDALDMQRSCVVPSAFKERLKDLLDVHSCLYAYDFKRIASCSDGLNIPRLLLEVKEITESLLNTRFEEDDYWKPLLRADDYLRKTRDVIMALAVMSKQHNVGLDLKDTFFVLPSKLNSSQVKDQAKAWIGNAYEANANAHICCVLKGLDEVYRGQWWCLSYLSSSRQLVIEEIAHEGLSRSLTARALKIVGLVGDELGYHQRGSIHCALSGSDYLKVIDHAPTLQLITTLAAGNPDCFYKEVGAFLIAAFSNE